MQTPDNFNPFAAFLPASMRDTFVQSVKNKRKFEEVDDVDVPSLSSSSSTSIRMNSKKGKLNLSLDALSITSPPKQSVVFQLKLTDGLYDLTQQTRQLLGKNCGHFAAIFKEAAKRRSSGCTVQNTYCRQIELLQRVLAGNIQIDHGNVLDVMHLALSWKCGNLLTKCVKFCITSRATLHQDPTAVLTQLAAIMKNLTAPDIRNKLAEILVEQAIEEQGEKTTLVCDLQTWCFEQIVVLQPETLCLPNETYFLPFMQNLLPHMKALRVLDFSAEEDIDARAILPFIKDLPHLENLCLERCLHLTDSNLAYLSRLPLKYLFLSGCDDSEEDVATNNFTALGLSYIRTETLLGLELLSFHCLQNKDLQVLATMQYLESLDIKACDQVDGDFLTYLKDLKNLQILNIDYLNLCDKHLQHLLPLPIEDLSLQHDKYNCTDHLTDAGVATLVQVKQLQRVNLHNRFTISEQAVKILLDNDIEVAGNWGRRSKAKTDLPQQAQPKEATFLYQPFIDTDDARK